MSSYFRGAANPTSFFPKIAALTAITLVALLAGCANGNARISPAPTAQQHPPLAVVSPGSTAAPTPTSIATSISADSLEPLRDNMLSLINADRAAAGARPVQLGSNGAAQQHAEDMLTNFYMGHVDSGGMKPYMRYSLVGGLGANAENVAYAGTTDPNDRANYVAVAPSEALQSLEHLMVFDDADSNWGHRDNILAPQHQVVNIGIAFTATRLALSQQFEDGYVTFTQAPKLANGTLTLAGAIDQSLGSVSAIDLYYDPPPVPHSHAELLDQPHSYSVGSSTTPVVDILPPAPQGSSYVNLPPYAVIANSWTGGGASFSISVNLGTRVANAGVYTLLLWSNGATYPLTTISLFVP